MACEASVSSYALLNMGCAAQLPALLRHAYCGTVSGPGFPVSVALQRFGPDQ